MREFKTVAEMRAHYAAVRARIYTPAPNVTEPSPEPDPWPPLPTAQERARAAEERRHQALMLALRERNSARQIIKLAAIHFGVSPEDVSGPKRTFGPIINARYVACFVLRERYGPCVFRKHHPLGKGLAWIGRLVGRDHSTVIHAIRRVQNSPRLLEAAATIQEQLTGKDGPYVEVESYVRHENEAFTLKRTSAGAHL